MQGNQITQATMKSCYSNLFNLIIGKLSQLFPPTIFYTNRSYHYTPSPTPDRVPANGEIPN